jgi:hypothetical protein
LIAYVGTPKTDLRNQHRKRAVNHPLCKPSEA